MRHGRGLLLALTIVLAAAVTAAAGPAEEVAPSLRAIAEMRASGDVQGAAQRASALVAQYPGDLSVHVAYQDVKLALGQEKEVLDSYRAAARAPAATADAHYLYARLVSGPAAITELRAAVKLDPRHFWALVSLGNELVRAKSWNEAKSALDEAAKARPDSAIPLNALGRLAEARGKREEAEKHYLAALALAPDLVVAKVNLGILYVGMGRQADALKTLNDAAAAAPNDPMPLLGLGMAYMAAKDPTQAVAAYKRAVALDANDVTSLNLLANAYTNLDQPDLAEAALLAAEKAAPGSLSTKINLAYLRVGKGQFDEALRLAGLAVAADESCAEAHYLLGLVFDHQANPKKAESEFRKAEKLDEDNPVFPRALAALAASQGDWKTAVAEYQKVVKLTSASTQSLMELADAYVDADKPKLGVSTYEQVVAQEPTRLEAWLEMGIVQRRDLRDDKKALKAFQEYVKRGGTDQRVPNWIKALGG